MGDDVDAKIRLILLPAGGLECLEAPKDGDVCWLKIDGLLLLVPSPAVIEVPGGAPTLAALQRLVGGYVDVVRLDDGLDLWVNDEGLLQGLPVNVVATALAQTPLVGAAVIARSDQDGETLGVTDEDAAMFSLRTS